MVERISDVASVVAAVALPAVLAVVFPAAPPVVLPAVLFAVLPAAPLAVLPAVPMELTVFDPFVMKKPFYLKILYLQQKQRQNFRYFLKFQLNNHLMSPQHKCYHFNQFHFHSKIPFHFLLL